MPFVFKKIIIAMGFTCNGSTFTGLALDYSTDYELYATITASSTWDADTEAKLKAKISGQTVLEETIYICDYISDGSSASCGEAGYIKMNLSDFLPDGATSTLMGSMITTSSIEIKAKPDGSSYEKCTKGSLSVAYQRSNGIISGNTSKAVGFAFGAIALAGLAAYAVKKKRSESAQKKKPTLKQRLFGGEMA